MKDFKWDDSCQQTFKNLKQYLVEGSHIGEAFLEMADGTLPKEKFRYYMVQDYLYLRDYVKIFAAILQKTDDFEQIQMCIRDSFTSAGS